MRALNAIWFDPQHERDFSLLQYTCIQTSSGAHPPPFQYVPEFLSAEENGQCIKLTTQPPSRAKVWNEWGYTSTPPDAFMAGNGVSLPLQ
jgi:hypothetical protein